MVDASAPRNSATISVQSGPDDTSEPLLSFRFGDNVESDGDSEVEVDVATRLKRTFVLEMQNAAGDRWRIRKDRYLCAASLTCLVIMVVQNILIWQLAHNDDPSRHGIIVDENKHPVLYNVVLGMHISMAVLTVAAIVLLVQYYYVVYKIKKNRWLQTIRKDTKTKVKTNPRYLPFAKELILKLVCEIIIQLIYPYPFLSRETFAYQALQLGMFLRLYLVLRIIHTTSRAFRKRGQIRSQYQDFRRMNLRVNWRLTLKMAFYKHMWTMIAAIAVCINFVLAFGLYVLERDTSDGDKFDDLGNCLWFSFVTFSTIGYGDMVPTTPSGKVTTVLLGVLGHVVMASFGGIVTNKLAPTKTQQLITEYLENDEADGHYKVAAATLIQSVWRAYKSRKHRKQKSGAAQALVHKIRTPGIHNAMRTREMVASAVKRFRQRRYQLAKSNLQAIDPVIDEKLDTLKTQLDEQGSQINRILKMLESSSGSLSPTSFDGHKRSVAPAFGGSPLGPGLGERRRSQLFSFRNNISARQSPVHIPVKKPSISKGSNPATATSPENSPISIGESRLQQEVKAKGRRPSVRSTPAMVGSADLPTIQLQQESDAESNLNFSLSMIPTLSPANPTHLTLPLASSTQKEHIPPLTDHLTPNPLGLGLDADDARRRSLDVPELSTKKTIPVGHPAGMGSSTAPSIDLWNPDRSTDSGSSTIESFDLDGLTQSQKLKPIASKVVKKEVTRDKDHRSKKEKKRRKDKKEKKKGKKEPTSRHNKDEPERKEIISTKLTKVPTLPYRNFSIDPHDL